MKSAIILLITACLIAACGGLTFASPPIVQTATPKVPTAIDTATFTASPTIVRTLVPSAIPTPTWVSQGPGHVLVPILMYHHITDVPIGPACVLNPDNYCVSLEKFDTELKLLRDWEYTIITTSALSQAITQGVSLPPRPVILTFDDANEDNYTNAFPIMKKYGFTGVLYLPYDYIGTPNYMTVDQIKEMISAGWEIGSHSMTHHDETFMEPAQLRTEIVDSRKMLEALLGVPILTFAYPFGDVTAAAVDYVHFAGYIAAMDAKGFTADQGAGNLFALQREEIRGGEDAKTFIRFLPWLGDPGYLPSNTPTPTVTPSRTPRPTWTP